MREDGQQALDQVYVPHNYLFAAALRASARARISAVYLESTNSTKYIILNSPSESDSMCQVKLYSFLYSSSEYEALDVA
jgi:hypothetical protein